MADPSLEYRHDLDYPDFKDFADYAKRGYALLPMPDVALAETKTGNKKSLPKKSSPVEMPNLSGQQRQFSFQTEVLHRKYGRELWFNLKLDKKTKPPAVLRNPASPQLSGVLKNGAAHKLYVVGIEGDHYLLSETPPETNSDQPL